MRIVYTLTWLPLHFDANGVDKILGEVDRRRPVSYFGGGRVVQQIAPFSPDMPEPLNWWGLIKTPSA